MIIQEVQYSILNTLLVLLRYVILYWNLLM